MAEQARDAYRAQAAFDRSVELDRALRELVKIRASQINGCAFCIDMHTFEARRMGESDRRLHAVGAWHESPLFSARERAALAVTEALTRVADAGLPDEVYARAAAELDTEEIAQLIMAVAAINSWNRIAIASGMVFEPPEEH
ncbi:MAG: carboxymuconolactone decarboxylase family protein [Solirubrobacterales bacterium]|nr:carboxymuconolactone decarboxylase family protein [Solirubrobacterales bacterium]